MNIAIKTWLSAFLILAISCKKENSNVPSASVTDALPAWNIMTFGQDATKYSAIKIGKQIWLQQNLAVSHYRNGDEIPKVDHQRWYTLTTGAWCWYNDDSATGAVYGKLYNWYAVNDPRGLTPKGWHIPNNTEWDSLAAHVGYHGGGRLKDTGTVQAGTGLWYTPNTGATNKTGFTGLPGGRRWGGFDYLHVYGYWWSSSEDTTYDYGWFRWLSYDNANLVSGLSYKTTGFSVRCIRD